MDISCRTMDVHVFYKDDKIILSQRFLIYTLWACDYYYILHIDMVNCNKPQYDRSMKFSFSYAFNSFLTSSFV